MLHFTGGHCYHLWTTMTKKAELTNVRLGISVVHRLDTEDLYVSPTALIDCPRQVVFVYDS